MNLLKFLDSLEPIKDVLIDDIELVINDSRDGETIIYPAKFAFFKKDGKTYAHLVSE